MTHCSDCKITFDNSAYKFCPFCGNSLQTKKAYPIAPTLAPWREVPLTNPSTPIINPPLYPSDPIYSRTPAWWTRFPRFTSCGY